MFWVWLGFATWLVGWPLAAVVLMRRERRVLKERGIVLERDELAPDMLLLALFWPLLLVGWGLLGVVGWLDRRLP